MNEPKPNNHWIFSMFSLVNFIVCICICKDLVVCIMKWLPSPINWLLLLIGSKIFKLHIGKADLLLIFLFFFVIFYPVFLINGNALCFFAFLFFDSIFSSLLFLFIFFLIILVYCLFFVSCYLMFFDAMFPVVFIPLELV